MEKKNPIEEARRYVANAKTLLKEKGELDPETHTYTDRKYDGYNILHLSMGYDGIQNKKVCDEGLSIANEIIERCSAMLPAAPVA